MPDSNRILHALAAFLAGNHPALMVEQLDITGAVISDGRIVVELVPHDGSVAVRAELGLMAIETVARGGPPIDTTPAETRQ